MARIVKPLTNFLEPAPTGVGEGFTVGEASENGALMAELMEHCGWALLQDMIDRQQRHEQLNAMRMQAGTVDVAGHERRIGQWQGLESVAAIAEGVVAFGKQADAKLESGARPEKEASSGSV